MRLKNVLGRGGAGFLTMAVLGGELATTQSAPTELRAGQVVTQRIVDGVPREYQITLQAGYAVHLVVEHKGIDIVVRVTSPDGTTLAEVDSPAETSSYSVRVGGVGIGNPTLRSSPPASMVVVARQNGAHRIRLSSLIDGASGAYELRVVAVRKATLADRRQSQATSGPQAAKLLVAMIEGVLKGDRIVGAGIVVDVRDENVYVATARHVVQRAEKLRVRFGAIPGDSFAAEVQPAAKGGLDLALLRVRGVKAFTAADLPFRILGDVTRLRRGDSVYYMGSGGGRPWRSNVTADRLADATPDALSFESLTIEPGASGGGLFNARWELVGMVVADQPPEGRALTISRILEELKKWRSDTQLRHTVLHSTWIAFMSRSPEQCCGDTYIMRPDGTGRTRLTDAQVARMGKGDKGLKFGGRELDALRWAPDGRSILFVKNADLVKAGGSAIKSVPGEIYRVGTDGTQPVNLTNHPASDTSPSWSPDGSLIAFISDRSERLELYVMSANGKTVVPLTRNSATRSSFGRSLAWSPDSKKVAFVITRERGPRASEIHVAIADGTRQDRLSREGDYASSPSWSPDGRQIAYASRRSIVIMDADGTNAVRLRPGDCCGADLHDVSWSPDGAQILFGADQAIWVVAADGSAPPTRLSDRFSCHSPVWSPDGRMIAFQAHFGDDFEDSFNNGEICVMNANGTDQRCLTRGRTNHVRLSWSPFFR